MKKNTFLILGIVVLSALGSNVFADTIDVVYLKNGSIIKGIVIEIIPNETIKIEIADGSIFVYPIDEVERIEKIEVVDKKLRTKVKLKSAGTARFISLTTGLFVLGGGQLYNGQYAKAVGYAFLGFGAETFIFIGVNARQDSIVAAGLLMMISGYMYSVLDAGDSANRINTERLKEASTSLRYIPNQGLMASYNMRF